MKIGRADYLGIFYRAILRMHPASFRDRFGGEMLWIFEEERGRGAAHRLLFDGFLSLLLQHYRVTRPAEPMLVGFGMLDTGSGIPARRFLEAGLTASLLLAGFVLLLGQGGRSLGIPCLPGEGSP